jgi:hypothetical protein
LAIVNSAAINMGLYNMGVSDSPVRLSYVSVLHTGQCLEQKC